MVSLNNLVAAIQMDQSHRQSRPLHPPHRHLHHRTESRPVINRNKLNIFSETAKQIPIILI
jgi:hypothetical protein